MGDMCVDYLDAYRKFFDSFTLSVDLSDQLPVKVAGYNLIEPEIAGAVADWTLQYLEQRKCPPFLIAHLVRKVVEEVKVLSKIDAISCGYRSEVGDFLSLKLMQACIGKLVNVCSRYKDNAELSSLPPPIPLPPVTTCAIKNSRRSMEDRHVVIHDFHTLFNIKGHGPASYYGVFDGHNGIDAAIYSVSHLHQYLAESPHYPDNPVLALKDACVKTDDLFSMKAQEENLHGGTTAVFALLRPKERKLYVAWLGDSQALLVRRGGIPLQIVSPHKPDRSDERDRIEGMGGTVLYWGAWRVNGQLAVSRAIGDVEYKPYVTAMPDVEEITLDGTEEFLILACDGLWDFVTDQEATDAVYKQLQENPEDLEAVSHRLVALSKEQSSQDNISVVVVFLAEPSEVAKRHLMETASPNPFVSRNGSDLFCGGPANGQHRPVPFDDEDFGPETDVDMVDDVLLSPAIAAAKALVHGAKETDDDLERQRQQLADFDDPADISRDTPTPPAHEVASNTNAENLAESGGEESEEEWNYIPGKDTKPASDTQEQDDMSSQLNPNAAEFVPVSPTRLLMLDDAIISASPRLGFETSMENVQLPTECEFEVEIAQRPGDLEFSNGPKHGDDYFMRDNFSTLRNKGKDINVSSTCAELGDDCITSLNSSMNSSTACASEDIPFDKLLAVQNIEEQVSSCVLEKANIFGENSDFSNTAFGATNIFGKSDPMTTSVIGLKDFAISPETEDGLIPGTPKSTIVEAPISPTDDDDDVSPTNHQVDLDSPSDDFLINAQKSPELVSPGDCPHETLTSGQERTSSSGFESESGAEEGEVIVLEENDEQFVTEHRRSPPIDLSFKPIQTFSDTNPFGVLQTPSTTTPLDDVNTDANLESNTPLSETPKKDMVLDKHNMNLLQNTPSSFISLRNSFTLEDTVPFDELESPKEMPHFEHPPNPNSYLLASELPKSPEPEKSLDDIAASIKQEPLDEAYENYDSTSNVVTQNVPGSTDDQHLSGLAAAIKQEPLEVDLDNKNFVSGSSLTTEKTVESTNNQHIVCEETDPHVEESSFTSENVVHDDSMLPKSCVDLDSTAEFVIEESKILHDEQECEQISKLHEDVNADIIKVTEETQEPSITVLVAAERDLPQCVVRPIVSVEHDLDEIKFDHDNKSTADLQVNEKETENHLETKEMKLELESHIPNSETAPEDIKSIEEVVEAKISPDSVKSIDDGFEVISKDELTFDDNIIKPHTATTENQSSGVDLGQFDMKKFASSTESDILSETKQTNPFVLNEEMSSVEKVSETVKPVDESLLVPETSVNNDLLSAIDNFSFALEENLIATQQSELLSTPLQSSPLEPVAKKSVSYQTLTPADEPKLSKTMTYVTGIEETVVIDKAISQTTEAENHLLSVDEPVTDVIVSPVETKLPVLEEPEPVLTKCEPVQSQVVTETLITTLEETSEVPSVATTEVPSTAGTPPPTPAPGLDSKDDSQKTDILVAAVAAAGAVAAGSAVVAACEVKKTTPGPAKKPLSSAGKKPSDSAVKAPAKSVPGKAPATKPAVKTTTTTTKPAGTASKLTSAATATKTAPTKPTAPTTGVKKVAPATTKPTASKPTTNAAGKPALSATAKPAAPPKQLSVSKTTSSVLKTSSKPSTPTSKPTTPTTPKSPSVLKSDITKSPPKPSMRPSLTASKSASSTPKSLGTATGEKTSDKKPVPNGDIKPITKKAEVPAKKPLTTVKAQTTTTKPLSATNVKPAAAAKPATSTTSKPPAKTATSTLPAKPKASSIAPKTSAPAPIKRPSSTTTAKTADKTGKEAINKQISSTKPALNGGKTTSTKPSTSAKKTDAKVNGKVSTDKPAPIKKPESMKKDEEKNAQVQEDNVTTTNGFPEHVIDEEHKSMKIEELAPVIVDSVN